MANTLTTEEWAAEVGTQLRQLRLRKEIDQKQLSEMAGVALNAVKNWSRAMERHYRR